MIRSKVTECDWSPLILICEMSGGSLIVSNMQIQFGLAGRTKTWA